MNKLEEAAKNHANIPLDRTIDSDERYYNSNTRLYDAFKSGAQWKEEEFKNESVADYIDRHIVESMVETGREFLNNNMYTEEEVIKLLETQRGNCYVAVLTACRDEEIASAATKAPEPGQWKKIKNQ
jgi:hypothetical protein